VKGGGLEGGRPQRTKLSRLRHPGPAGFTLLEVTIALALLGVALLLGMALLLSQKRIVRRLDADQAARGALEAALEAIRAGALPLQSASYGGGDLAAVAGAGGPPVGMTLAIDVTPSPTPGLYEVALRARYRVAGQDHERRLGTMVWQPPAAAP